MYIRTSTDPAAVWWLWLGALDMHPIVDGHDRLQAAVLEGVAPRVVTVWQPIEEAFGDTEWRDERKRG